MSTQSDIDAMVSAQAQSMNVTANENTGNSAMSVTVERSREGEFSAGPVRIEGKPPTSARIADSGGTDPVAEAQAIQKNINQLQSKLDAVEYNRDTGAPEHVLQGEQRRVIELQAEQARRSADYQLARLEALKAQRAADAEPGPTADPRGLIALLSGGNPAKAKEIEAAMQRQDAEALATMIRNQTK